MGSERWFPVKHKLPDGSVLGRLSHSGREWQIYRVEKETWVLTAHRRLANRWVESKFVPEAVFGSLEFGKEEYSTILSGEGQRLEPVSVGRSPATKADGLSFAVSLRETRKVDPAVPLHDAIYVERYSRLLPTWTVSEASTDEEILGRWLTGGVSIPATSFRRLSSLLGWLDRQDVADLVAAAGFSPGRDSGGVRRRASSEGAGSEAERGRVIAGEPDWEREPEGAVRCQGFQLPGRPVLEAFFNEHVIDLVENAERYRALGIEFPSAIILHGPPGCGKTFAVERLLEYLDWPVFHIDPKSVGSPYIHETSRKVGEVFERAAERAPSMIVIDEMESYLSDRLVHESTGSHHVEEVAEFLRRIPEANSCHVLVIGMTNRLGMIDSALLRRGRFDHIIEVGMPCASEVSDLVASLLSKVPVQGEIDTCEVVQSLTGRALSDAAFVVREASRLAARAGKSAVDVESLRQALASLPRTEPKKRPIGFFQE